MFDRANWTYFSGTVQKVTMRESIHAVSQGGGGFIYRGFGFIAPPSVSVRSRTIQEFWVKAAQEERNFSIWGASLPMREGQTVTAVWLKDQLVAYANHATSHYLLVNGGLEAAAGRKRKTLVYVAIAVAACVGLTAISFTGMDTRSNSYAIRNTWAMIGCLSLLGAIAFIILGSVAGLLRFFAYASRRQIVTGAIEQEMKSLLSRAKAG